MDPEATSLAGMGETLRLEQLPRDLLAIVVSHLTAVRTLRALGASAQLFNELTNAEACRRAGGSRP